MAVTKDFTQVIQWEIRLVLWWVYAFPIVYCSRDLRFSRECVLQFLWRLRMFGWYVMRGRKERKPQQLKRSSCKNKLRLGWWEHLLRLHCRLETHCIPRRPIRSSWFVMKHWCKLINKACKVNNGFSFSYYESHSTKHLRMIHWLPFILSKKSIWDDEQQMTFTLI